MGGRRVVGVRHDVAREYASGGATFQAESWEAAKEQDGTVDVLTSGRKMRVQLHPEIEHDVLDLGRVRATAMVAVARDR